MMDHWTLTRLQKIVDSNRKTCNSITISFVGIPFYRSSTSRILHYTFYIAKSQEKTNDRSFLRRQSNYLMIFSKNSHEYTSIYFIFLS